MDAVFHLAQARIVYMDPTYVAWMRSFGPNCNHIFLGTGASSNLSAFQASTIMLRKLSKLTPELYPALSVSPVIPGIIDTYKSELACKGLSDMGPIFPAKPSMRYNLLPTSQHGWSTSHNDGCINDVTDEDLEKEADSYIQTFFSDGEQSIPNCHKVIESEGGDTDSGLGGPASLSDEIKNISTMSSCWNYNSALDKGATTFDDETAQRLILFCKKGYPDVLIICCIKVWTK